MCHWIQFVCIRISVCFITQTSLFSWKYWIQSAAAQPDVKRHSNHINQSVFLLVHCYQCSIVQVWNNQKTLIWCFYVGNRSLFLPFTFWEKMTNRKFLCFTEFNGVDQPKTGRAVTELSQNWNCFWSENNWISRTQATHTEIWRLSMWQSGSEGKYNSETILFIKLPPIYCC